MFKLGVILSGATLAAGQAATIAGYCQALWDNCPNQHGFTNNATLHNELCQATMAGWNTVALLGDLSDKDVNSLGCRQRYLTDATLNATATKCQYAAPTGGGRCGSLVDAVCLGATSACSTAPSSSYPNATECQTALAPYVAQWGFKQGVSAGGEDTLECRLYHAITGLATNFNDTSGLNHCLHFVATGGPCTGAPATDARHYCETVTYHCSKSNATNQWPLTTSSNGYPECIASVGVFGNSPNDARASNQNNSLGCREYHAQAAASVSASIHCEHAGPSGGGQCGTYTDAWIALAGVATCNGSKAIDVGRATTDIKSATTLTKMIPVGANGTYNTFIPWDNSQRCRLYHLTTASVLPDHCSHGSVSGGGVCGNYVDNLCTFIEGACGFGSSTYQFNSSSACKAALSSTQPGSEADRANNTLQCRFYHASVAASYATGGRLAGDAGAAQKMKDHCNHVLATTMTGGCNAGVTPTPATKNDASAVSVFGAVFVAAVSMFAF